MKRKLLSVLLTLCLAFSLLPTAALAEEPANVAKVDGVEYPTLAEAVAAVADGGTVTLLKSATGGAVGTFKGAKEGQIEAKSFTIDFGGYTYTVTNPAVGSTGYESQAFHLERSGSDDENHKVTFKNGTITTAENFGGRMLIQNYCDLTLENMTIIGDSKISYVISNNFGSLTAKGNTVIKAADGKVAFDLWYGMNNDGLYDGGVSVTFGTDFTGSVTGKIEYGAHSRVPSNSNWKDKARLTIANGNFDTTFVDSNNNDGVAPEDFNITITGGTFTSDVSAYVPDRYIYNSETKTVEPLGETNAVAKVGDTYYKTLADAVAAVPTNGTETTITLLNNVIFTGHININDGKNIILDLNGHDVVSTDAEVFDVYHSKFHVTGSGSINEAVKDGYAPIIARGSGTDTADYTVITIDKTVTLKGDYSGIFVAKDDANSYKNYGLVINMYGSIELAKDGVSGYAIYINGMNQVMDGNVTTFNLTGAQISGDAGCGIYAAGYAVWKLKDTTITGENALSLKAGNFIIDGGAYKSTGQYVNPSSDTSNGAVETGAALSLTSNDGYAHKLDVTVNGGTFESVHGNAVYEGIPLSEKEPHTPVASKSYVTLKINDGNFKSAADKAVADLTEIENKQVISGGLFSSDPSAYVADGHYVDASNNGDYPYTVKAGTKPAGALIVVKDKTDAAVNEGIKTEDKKAIHDVIGDANIDGVAEAVTPAKKADIVMKSGVTLTGSEKVEIEIAVKVEAKDADLVNGKLTFEVTPEATVKVDGTEQSKKVPVTNDMLNGKPITVKLPLPTVNGSRFTPKQILHKFTGGGYEYFINESVGGMRGAGRFKIEDNCAVFTIYGFSTFELSGTVTYVEPSYSSGSSYDPTYSVTVDKTENGSVTASPKSASKGDTVTVTVKPDSGYVLETLTVTDKNGNELTLKDKGNGKYTFTMPAGKVEVKATFMEDNSMLNFFYDVPNNAYFYEAVKWAVKNGITTGVGNDLFAPEQPCTRAQIVTFLWRAAGSPEPEGAASGMSDVVSGSYYEKAVAWAIENGITTGTTTSTFSPDATCTRAQAVTFLARALKAKAASAAEFSDVPTDSYFADAVAWAAANGVTEGIGGGLFGSDNDCTRGQIVTFLYRAYNK